MKCFVIMPFSPEGAFRPVYEAIKAAFEESTENSCEAGWEIAAGPIHEQVVAGIKNADCVIADLSGGRSNVALEAGIAQFLGKPLILITHTSLSDVPFALNQQRVHIYSAKNLSGLTAYLKQTVPLVASPQLLQEMLAPRSLRESLASIYVAASPRSYREARKQGSPYEELTKTYGDLVGIRGLIQSYGIVLGLDRPPELVSPDDFDRTALGKNEQLVNLCCIGSPKSNPWTASLLERVSLTWSPRFEFRPDPGSADIRNPLVMIRRVGKVDPFLPPLYEERCPGKSWDFGMVLRVPYPLPLRGSESKHSAAEYAQRMVLILAGRKALGTEAACRAATTPKAIERIGKLLTVASQGEWDLDDHQRAFVAWAVMQRPAEEYAGDPATLQVLGAEPLAPDNYHG